MLPDIKTDLPVTDENPVISNNRWSSRCLFLSQYSLSYWFFIHLILLVVLSIIQLRFSIVYEDQCTAEDRIILYLYHMSIIEIVYSFNGILLIIISLLYIKYPCFSLILIIDFLIHHILLILLIIWFIAGNYFVFHIKQEVQYTNSYNIRTYCDFTLYQTAFWTTILYYILIILFSMLFVFTNLKWFLKHIKTNCKKTSDPV